MNFRGGVISLCLCATIAQADPAVQPITLADPAGDVRLRRTDPGADAPWLPPVMSGRAGAAPDVVNVTFGGWWLSPGQQGWIDPFKGQWSSSEEPALVRVDIVFAGLVNPPGPVNVGEIGGFNPYLFGNSPLYGCVEFDVDGRRNTGGEIGDLALHRFNGFVARFGEMPSGSDADRVARFGSQLDANFFTAPQFERTGAEFVLTFCGCFVPEVQWEHCDNLSGDTLFGPGETWLVRGRFFERAPGLQAASAAFGGSAPGLYDPEVTIRFAHSPATDRTTVSLVYPLTQFGAALLRGSFSAQPSDYNAANDTSVREALEDIIEGASDPFLMIDHPDTWELVSGWKDKCPDRGTRPSRWEVRAGFATVSSQPQKTGQFIWSDAGFNLQRADFDADGLNTAQDRALLTSYVLVNDGSVADCDALSDGQVHLCDHGPNFCVYDLDDDGVVGILDAGATPPMLAGDYNLDCRVGTADLVFFIARFGTTSGATYETGDFDGDGAVTSQDLVTFLGRFGSDCF
ncbi:MAG: hypothetical protein J0L61_01980 [Planctomycetes bacterium]|nr:hypothetical protein [Planctomycetota bacterium]